ncbi:rhodanese-like domain-containing protein, partial [Bilophila wadsworthia]
EKGERVTVLNVGHSEAHKAGHIPGAIWVSRSRIELARDAIRMGGRVVLTSESDLQASLAADDAKEFYPEADICWLEGGTSAWKAAGLEIENVMPASIGPVEDVRYLIYQDPHATKESLLPFFDWENKYAAQVMADGSCRYKLPY